MARLINHYDIASEFKKLEAAISEWGTRNATVAWHGQNARYIDQAMFEAFEALCSLAGTDSAEFHEGAREIAMAIDRLAVEFLRYADLMAARSTMVDPAGPSSLWQAVECVRQLCVRREWPQPEPIEQLVNRDKVPAWQVAKIYGWEDGRGGYDVNKVQQELVKPGTHYDPKTWVHPSQVSFQRRINEQWEKRKPVEGVSIKGSSAKLSEAPESLETLIQQRVPLRQICEMKGVAPEVVEELAARMGVNLAGARFVRPAAEIERVAERMKEEDQRQTAFDELTRRKLTEEAQATAKKLKSQNMRPEIISKKLAEQYPALDVGSLLAQ